MLRSKNAGQRGTNQTGSGRDSTDTAPLDNVYLESLLWLTPENPFGNLQSTTITYAFGNAGAYEVHTPESTQSELAATAWGGSNVSPTAEQAAVWTALNAWTCFTNITLSRATGFEDADFKFLVTDEPGMRDYWDGEAGVLGFSTLPNDYGPNYGITGKEYSPGYSVLNQDGYGWTDAGLLPGGYGYLTILHEVGHLFGLDHPWNEGGFYQNGAPEPFFPGATSAFRTGTNGLNQGIFTSMSYNDGWSGQPSKSADWGWQIGPGAFDIAAMQELYGARQNYLDGGQTYLLPTANEAGTGWFCIYDSGASGFDTIMAPESAGAATIDLRAATLLEGDPGAGGYVSWVKGVAGGFTIANGVTIENGTGGNGADTITGNAVGNVLIGLGGNDRLDGLGGRDDLRGGAGKDTLLGGGGADDLWGGDGADILTGGGDADTFTFRSASEVGLGAARDTITDFASAQRDQLDFSTFLVGTREVDFYFVGSKGFTAGDGHVGELSFAKGILSGDYNNDARADFQIVLSGVTRLSDKDFDGLLLA